MKNFLLVLIAVFVIFLVGAYAKLLTKQVSYQRDIVTATSSVVKIENIDKTKVKIIVADVDEIQVNLQGSDEDLAGLKLDQDSIFTKFGFSDEWSNISGTIIVPEGTLIDVTLSDAKNVIIDDVNGEKVISQQESFLIDTSTLDSFSVGGSGDIQLDAWGDLIIWDDENWESLGGEEGEEEGTSTAGGEEGDEQSETVDETSQEEGDETIMYCGIGSQAIRDYCCVNENEGVQTPACDGIGYFYFDNILRECTFFCEAIEEEPVDCGIGGQLERDNCCVLENAGVYGGCIGSWYYNNAMGECDFQCDEYGEVPDEGGSGDSGDSYDPWAGLPEIEYDDPISNYCADIRNYEDRNNCCNDALKNELSTGPRTGFPDCIGIWEFIYEDGCTFRCAERAEMLEILQEIRDNLPQE